MRSACAPRRAFTLLEMLVALGLMGLLGTALYASLHTGLRAQRSATAAVDPVRSVALALGLLGRDLGSALPPAGVLAGAFVGQDGTDAATQKAADTLAWYGAVRQPKEGETDVAKIETAVTSLEDTAERVLVRRETRNLLAPTEQTPEEEVLCRKVISLNLRYFDGSSWLDAWDSTAQGDVLPLAVEATLEIERAPRSGAEASTYQLTRVFSLPCARIAAEDETRVQRSASW